MSKEWKTGDVIAANDMNRIESGALPKITFSGVGSARTCDKTFEDLQAIVGNDVMKAVLVCADDGDGYLETYGDMNIVDSVCYIMTYSLEINGDVLSFIIERYTVDSANAVTYNSETWDITRTAGG